MRITSVITLSAALLLSSTAMAQARKLAANEQPSASKSYQASDDQSGTPVAAEKKICKRLATSGTRMAKRSCLTKQQWEKVAEEAK
jgi:hypothetical protein